jgi:hypothetical protein
VSRNENKLKAAEGLKDSAVSSAMAKAAERKPLPSVELENLKSNFDRFVSAAKVNAKAIVQATEKEAAVILANAEAEGKSTAFLEAKRAYDYCEKKIRMETSLLEAVPLVNSGKNGDELIQRTFLEAVQPTN